MYNVCRCWRHDHRPQDVSFTCPPLLPTTENHKKHSPQIWQREKGVVEFFSWINYGFPQNTRTAVYMWALKAGKGRGGGGGECGQRNIGVGRKGKTYIYCRKIKGYLSIYCDIKQERQGWWWWRVLTKEYRRSRCLLISLFPLPYWGFLLSFQQQQRQQQKQPPQQPKLHLTNKR